MNALRCTLLALCLVAALLVAGCGSSKSSSSSNAGSSTSATTPTTSATTPIANPFPKPHGSAHPGAKVDHLIVKDVVKGTGAEIHAGDSGLFDFIGTIYVSGKPLDASWGKKRPAKLQIDHGVVIDGWWQGVPGMHVGGRRVLIIPPSLGFTNNATPGLAGQATYFDIVLRAVIPARPAGVGQGGTTGQGGAGGQ